MRAGDPGGRDWPGLAYICIYPLMSATNIFGVYTMALSTMGAPLGVLSNDEEF